MRLTVLKLDSAMAPRSASPQNRTDRANHGPMRLTIPMDKSYNLVTDFARSIPS